MNKINIHIIGIIITLIILIIATVIFFKTQNPEQIDTQSFGIFVSAFVIAPITFIWTIIDKFIIKNLDNSNNILQKQQKILSKSIDSTNNISEAIDRFSDNYTTTKISS